MTLAAEDDGHPQEIHPVEEGCKRRAYARVCGVFQTCDFFLFYDSELYKVALIGANSILDDMCG